LDLLVRCGTVTSKGEGRRLIQGGGVRVNGEKVSDFRRDIPLIKPFILQVGKRRIFRVIPQSPKEG
jgi:tyrosyl-tRNA synthetase